MKILHVLDHSIPLHSGYTFRTRSIVDHQRALGWETFHLTGGKQGRTERDEETVDGLTFFRCSAVPGWQKKVPLIGQAVVSHGIQRRLIEVASKVRPDVLHAHSPALNGIAALKAGKVLGIPVVYEVRAFWEDAAVDHGTSREGGLRYRMTRALETYVLRRASAVTTICEGLREDIVARGVYAGKVTVIPNAVDLEQFTYGDHKDQALAAELDCVDRPVIGFIGSFYAYEGLSLALEAFSQVARSYPEARLLLVGGGPEETRLRAQCAQLNLNEQVMFTGRIPHAEVGRYYSLVDILVYPRLPMRLTETVTPLKPLEAMAQGKLVIASDVGGHRELIVDGETGYLFPAGSCQQLAETIVTALGDRAAWPEVLRAGRKFVEQERTWTASVGRYQAVYANALEAGGKRTDAV